MFRCLDPNHLVRDCKTEVNSSICYNDYHHTALHENRTKYFDRNSERTIKKKLMCKTGIMWYAEQSSRPNHALRLS